MEGRQHEPYVAVPIAVLRSYGVCEARENRVHAQLVSARPYLQTMDAAPRSERCILAAAAKGEQPVTRVAAQAAKGCETFLVAAVRSRGEQHHVRRLRAKCGNRVVDILTYSGGCRALSFIGS